VELRKLAAKVENTRAEFLQADLALCFTFVDRFRLELEMGNRNAAQRLLAKTDKGYVDILRFLIYLTDVRRRDEIKQELNRIRMILHSARHRLRWESSIPSSIRKQSLSANDE